MSDYGKMWSSSCLGVRDGELLPLLVEIDRRIAGSVAVEYLTHMIRFFRFSPSRLALGYIALSVPVLAILPIPLWYAWRVNSRSSGRMF